MPVTNAASAPWQELEEQAYHAYREWHLWLVLRERELGDRHTGGRAEQHPPGTAGTAQGTERPTAAQGEDQ